MVVGLSTTFTGGNRFSSWGALLGGERRSGGVHKGKSWGLLCWEDDGQNLWSILGRGMKEAGDVLKQTIFKDNIVQ